MNTLEDFFLDSLAQAHCNESAMAEAMETTA
jgi:hypothetical protein